MRTNKRKRPESSNFDQPTDFDEKPELSIAHTQIPPFEIMKSSLVFVNKWVLKVQFFPGAMQLLLSYSYNVCYHLHYRSMGYFPSSQFVWRIYHDPMLSCLKGVYEMLPLVTLTPEQVSFLFSYAKTIYTHLYDRAYPTQSPPVQYSPSLPLSSSESSSTSDLSGSTAEVKPLSPSLVFISSLWQDPADKSEASTLNNDSLSDAGLNKTSDLSITK